LKLAKLIKQFGLYAFSIIYDHVNLLIEPGLDYNISQIIKSLKENTSRDINYIIRNNTNEGDTSTCRLHLRRSIKQWQREFNHKYNPIQEAMPDFKWQKSFHDHIIRRGKDFHNHYKYTIDNPNKHGLPDNWSYTSVYYPDIIDIYN
jgi:REP element-mobilizing transposase RayT